MLEVRAAPLSVVVPEPSTLVDVGIEPVVPPQPTKPCESELTALTRAPLVPPKAVVFFIMPVVYVQGRTLSSARAVCFLVCPETQPTCPPHPTGTAAAYCDGLPRRLRNSTEHEPLL